MNRGGNAHTNPDSYRYPTPEPAPAAPGEITLFSLARDVFAMFSEGEQSCISGQVGEATYQGMLSQPLAAVIGVPGNSIWSSTV